MSDSAAQKTFILEFWVMAEIDQKTDIEVGGVEVIENLSLMFTRGA
jgi:hypothetical protein